MPKAVINYTASPPVTGEVEHHAELCQRCHDEYLWWRRNVIRDGAQTDATEVSDKDGTQA